MLICNKRKICSKENCPHAIKHLPTPKCYGESTDFCSGIENRKCKHSGMSLHRVEKSANARKAKQPITQSEAQNAVKILREMTLVEYRLSGNNISKDRINMENVISGLDSNRITMLFPDARKRGLHRHIVINSLDNELQRQNSIHWERVKRRMKILSFRSMNDRQRIIKNTMTNTFATSLKRYYGTCWFRPTFISVNKEKRDIPFLQVTKAKKKQLSIDLEIPMDMVITEIESHNQHYLIILNYEDKDKLDFECFALIGRAPKLKLIPTIVENGKFKDNLIF